MKNKIPNLVKASAFMLALIIPFLLIVSCPGEGGSNKEKLFTVTKGASENGTFTVSPNKAKEGAVITLKPTPDTGYRFDDWDIVPPQTVTLQNDGTYAFLMPGEKVTVSASFKPDDGKYNIIKGTPVNGTFTVEPSSLEAEAGDTVTLKPTASSGYVFDDWEIVPAQTVTPQTNGTYTFVMPAANVSVNALFKAGSPTTQYNIFKGITDNGSFDILPAALKAAAGAKVTLNPTANTECEFDHFETDPVCTINDEGYGYYSFTMPASDVTVNGIFNKITYTITKGTHANGDFTIDPAELKAAKGDIITLEPTAENNYYFDSFNVVPAQAITDEGGGIYTFEMPNAAVTINAVFYKVGIPGTGVKTITFESGLGKVITKGSGSGTDVFDGTRHMTITTTMADGAITDIVLGHADIIVKHPVTGWVDAYNSHNPYQTQTTALITAIKNAKNPDAAYTVSGLAGNALAGWAKHEKGIRDAIKAAVAALEQGKPNRLLEGGGSGIPWTVDGVPLSGEAEVTGSGHMISGGQANGTDIATDMTVYVKLESGMITTILVSNCNDLYCGQAGSATYGNIGTRLSTTWPTAMKANNTYMPIIPGYAFGSNTDHWNTQSIGAGWGTAAVGDAIGGCTRTYRGLAGLVQMALYQIANEY